MKKTPLLVGHFEHAKLKPIGQQWIRWGWGWGTPWNAAEAEICGKREKEGERDGMDGNDRGRQRPSIGEGCALKPGTADKKYCV